MPSDDELEAALMKHATPMYRMALLSLGDASDAQDVVAAAMARVWERAHGHQINNLGGYLRTSVLNEIRNRSRRRRRGRRALAILSATPSTAPDHADVVADHATLHAALQRLPAGQRMAVVLRCYVGLDVAETAKMLQAPEGTVTSWTARGLERMREHLEVSP